MVYFLQKQEFPDSKMIAAATVIVICDHITAGFHHTKTIIINAKIPLQWQDSPVAQVSAGFIATFFFTFFFAIFILLLFSSSQST